MVLFEWNGNELVTIEKRKQLKQWFPMLFAFLNVHNNWRKKKHRQWGGQIERKRKKRNFIRLVDGCVCVDENIVKLKWNSMGKVNFWIFWTFVHILLFLCRLSIQNNFIKIYYFAHKRLVSRGLNIARETPGRISNFGMDSIGRLHFELLNSNRIFISKVTHFLRRSKPKPQFDHRFQLCYQTTNLNTQDM